MKLFKLLITTPDRVYYEGEVYQVTVMQADGVRQILSGHIPAIGVIVSGKCSFTDARKIKRIFITSDGILNVTKDLVTISASTVQSEKAYEKAQEDAENEQNKEIERRKKSREEYVRSKVEMAKSLSGKKADSINNN